MPKKLTQRKIQARKARVVNNFLTQIENQTINKRIKIEKHSRALITKIPKNKRKEFGQFATFCAFTAEKILKSLQLNKTEIQKTKKAISLNLLGFLGVKRMTINNKIGIKQAISIYTETLNLLKILPLEQIKKATKKKIANTQDLKDSMKEIKEDLDFFIKMKKKFSEHILAQTEIEVAKILTSLSEENLRNIMGENAEIYLKNIKKATKIYEQKMNK